MNHPTRRMLAGALAAGLGAATAAAQSCFDANLGAPLNLTDESFSPPIPFGFGFAYGGQTWTECQVCSNGYVVLGSGSPSFPDWSPSINELLLRPLARICPLWRNLDPSLAGQVWANAAPATPTTQACFTVTYDAVAVKNTSFVNTCQLVLFADGTIQMHHDADTRDGDSRALWVIGASPGNGAQGNYVAFASLPLQTNGDPTLHDVALNAPQIGRSTMTWTPDGAGGYVVDATPNCAAKSDYGVGCAARLASAYEYFAAATAFDLANQGITGLNLGRDYLCTQGSATFRAPGPQAVNLMLFDDDATTWSPSAPLPTPEGPAGTLYICSNGFVATGVTGTIFGGPGRQLMLDWPFRGWACWRDFAPTPLQNVFVEEANNTAYVTWDGVPSFQTGGRSTFQYQFDLGSGDWHLVFQSMDATGTDDWLVGHTPGNGARDPGALDWTGVTTGAAIVLTPATDILPIDLDADAAPIIGTMIGLVTSNLQPTAQFGGLLLGLTRFDPGLDLTPFGMAGCRQHNDMLAVLLFTAGGAPTATTMLTIPGFPGTVLQAQSAVFDPTVGLTALGGLTSDAVELRVGF